MTRAPFVLLAATTVALTLAVPTACGRPGAPQTVPSPRAAPMASAPSELRAGEALYNQYCANCHGPQTTGTDKGPPFLDPVYNPSHHPDQAFLLAPKVGVHAHHWQFGDMPPVEGITDEETAQIVPYIRWLQQQVGIR